MGNAKKDIPTLQYGNKIYPESLVLPTMPVEGGNVWFVDGDIGSGDHGGRSWEDAFSETEFDGALSDLNIRAGDVVYIAGRTMSVTDTDPVSYTANINIDVPQVSLIGVSRGRTQGGLPQFKVGATTTSPIINIAAPGVLLFNLGINGIGGTGGGVELDDDGGTTSAVIGTSILGCHFKNCVGTTATDSRTGGAIMWSANGGAWQTLISGNRFYKNVGDVVLKGTSVSVPQDVIIEDNIFSGPAANTDCNLFLKGGGSGMNGVIIRDNLFTAMPAIGSGSVARFMDLTGCVGLLAGNHFACKGNVGAEELTFKADGTAAYVPATVFMTGNYAELDASAGETGEVFRTA